MADRNETMVLARKWLEAHKEEMVNDLKEFVRIRSVSRSDLASSGAPFGAETVKMLSYALLRSAAYGFETKDADGYYGLVTHGDGDNSIGMIAHLDVVPEGVNWIYPPYEAVREGDFLFGRGSSDNKAAAIAGLYIMRMVKELGIRMNHGIRLILGLSEETGMQDMEHYNQTEKPCVVTLVPDSSFPVCYAQKGSLSGDVKIALGSEIGYFRGGEVANMVPPVCECVVNLPYNTVCAAFEEKGFAAPDFELSDENGKTRVTAHGVASHAASPENGKSAIHMLSGALSSAGILSGDSLRAMQAVSFLSQGFYGEHAGIAAEDEDTGKTTMVIGTARCENGWVRLSIDCRRSIKADTERDIESMRKAVTDAGFTVISISATEPVYMPKDDPRVQALQKVYCEMTGDDAQPYTMGGGTYSRCLENAITFGPGMPTLRARPENLPAGHGGAHAPDEYQYLPALFESTLILLASILALDEMV